MGEITKGPKHCFTGTKYFAIFISNPDADMRFPKEQKPACRWGLVSSLAYVHRGPGASAKVSVPGRLLEESEADPSLYVPDMHLLIQRCRGWQPLPRSPCALRGKDALSDTHSLGPGIGLGTRQAQYRRPNFYITRTAFLDLGKPFWLQCSHL